MNKIRLSKLAEVLENFKTERKVLAALPGNGKVGGFNLGSWGSKGENVCSTTACAAGTAALHPWFIDKGLKMVHHKKLERFGVKFKDRSDFGACATFFNLEFNDALFLFDPGKYPYDRRGEKSVARRIRYLIAGGKNRGRYAGLKG